MEPVWKKFEGQIGKDLIAAARRRTLRTDKEINGGRGDTAAA